MLLTVLVNGKKLGLFDALYECLGYRLFVAGAIQHWPIGSHQVFTLKAIARATVLIVVAAADFSASPRHG